MTKKRYKITATTYDKKGRFLATATNSYTKSHPIQAHFASLVGEPARIYLHAEIAALLKSSIHPPSHIHIISTSLSLPYPCAVCMKALRAYGISSFSLFSNHPSYKGTSELVIL